MSVQDLLGLPPWQGNGRDKLRQEMYDTLYDLVIGTFLFFNISPHSHLSQLYTPISANIIH